MTTITEPFTTTSSALTVAHDHSPAQAAPAEEAIALRAYQIFLQSGGHDGHALDHWLEAERELGRAPAHEA